MLGDVPVVVIRDGQHTHVLADRCSHLSGPLSDGEYRDGCLTCPWHGSTFRVSDGTVARGPATAPQPAFRTRVSGGTLQACLPGAGERVASGGLHGLGAGGPPRCFGSVAGAAGGRGRSFDAGAGRLGRGRGSLPQLLQGAVYGGVT